MRTILLIVLFGLFHNLCYAQPAVSINDVHNAYDEKGDFYFGKKNYKKAIVYFTMAFQQDAANYYSVLRKGEAYTALGLYDQAAECYRVIFSTTLDIPNNYRLEYAILLLKNKDIKGFEKWLGKYNEVVYAETSDKLYLSSSEVRNKMYKDSTIVLVENENTLNTAESEICPVVYKDKLIFASTRKNLSGDAANPFYNLFSATFVDGGQLGKLNTYNASLNTTQNESSVTFADNKMYFNRSAALNS
jgi:tetratricopeptide (TPR) repeat protein